MTAKTKPTTALPRSASAAASTTPAKSIYYTNETKALRRLRGKNTLTTPSKPALSPRLRLDKDNFHMTLNKKPDTFYEEDSTRDDAMELHQKPIDEDDAKHTTLQQLLSISYQNAPNFFERMKQSETQEDVLHKDSQKNKYSIENHTTTGEDLRALHCATRKTEQTIETNGATSIHDWNAINDFLNIYLYNFPTEYPQAAPHLRQPQYLTVIHTTEWWINELSNDLTEQQQQRSGWYTRKALGRQFQIHGDRNTTTKRQSDKDNDIRLLSWTSKATNNTTSTTTP
eukprot:6265800-Amphidinium_carterae.1